MAVDFAVAYEEASIDRDFDALVVSEPQVLGAPGANAGSAQQRTVSP